MKATRLIAFILVCLSALLTGSCRDWEDTERMEEGLYVSLLADYNDPDRVQTHTVHRGQTIIMVGRGFPWLRELWLNGQECSSRAVVSASPTELVVRIPEDLPLDAPKWKNTVCLVGKYNKVYFSLSIQ